MSQTQTVTINGRLYDALTGMPVIEQRSQTQPAQPAVTASQPRQSSQSAASIHAHMQRSQTLNRRLTKKPESISVYTQAKAAAPASSRSRHIVAKSPAITKFAPHPQPVKRSAPKPANAVQTVTPRRQMNDIAPTKNPVAVKAQQLQVKKAAAKQVAKNPAVAPVQSLAAPKPATKLAHPPAREIKNSVIEQALKNAPNKKEQKAPKKRSFFARHPRLLSIASASFALVLLGGYFTYLNLPNLSVRVAAAQAGINASYPDYQPDGYSLNGPVAAESGKVQMKFASNAGPQNFVITQEKSSWDSSAVVNNLVAPKSNDSYITTNERGLTIYTYGGNAAWVNGGILYTIEGNAPLSSEQIRRIATSL